MDTQKKSPFDEYFIGWVTVKPGDKTVDEEGNKIKSGFNNIERHTAFVEALFAIGKKKQQINKESQTDQ